MNEKQQIDELTSTDRKKISSMFDSIAGNYDFLNHFLSFGIDYRWRKKLIKKIGVLQPDNILDLATGTGDLAIAAQRLNPSKVIGIDISSKMLDVGRKKLIKKKLQNKIELLEYPAENLPFENESFDAATVAFGVRNFEELEKGLSEVFRVLKPGGIFCILEFSTPKKFPVKQLYKWYSFKLLPFMGKMISGDASAYTYLPYSVSRFPEGKEFMNILQNCGFNSIELKTLSMSIVSLYSARK